MASLQTITVASASSDPSAYTKVVLSKGTNVPVANDALGDQCVRVCPEFSDGSATATGMFVLKDAAQVYKTVPVTFTNGTVRTSLTGAASGGYLGAAEVNNIGGSSSILTTYLDTSGVDEAAGREWYFGCPSLSAGTLKVHLIPVRAI